MRPWPGPTARVQSPCGLRGWGKGGGVNVHVHRKDISIQYKFFKHFQTSVLMIRELNLRNSIGSIKSDLDLILLFRNCLANLV